MLFKWDQWLVKKINLKQLEPQIKRFFFQFYFFPLMFMFRPTDGVTVIFSPTTFSLDQESNSCQFRSTSLVDLCLNAWLTLLPQPRHKTEFSTHYFDSGRAWNFEPRGHEFKSNWELLFKFYSSSNQTAPKFSPSTGISSRITRH